MSQQPKSLKDRKDTPPEELTQQLIQEGERYFQFLFADLLGGIRCMEENIDNLPKIAKKGVTFDGSSVPGYAQVNASDLRVIPDMDTISWAYYGDDRVGRVLCRVVDHNKPHPGCPRTIMRNVVEKARALGFEPKMFGELEWYFLKQDGTPMDNARYLDLPPLDAGEKIRHKLGDLLIDAGCLVKRIHHEGGPGQNEVELKLTPAMKNADDLFIATNIIKNLAHENNLTADFLPKPFPDEAGSGLHQHNALYDINTKKNVFAGDWSKGEYLSQTALYFIGGLIEHAPEITAIFARHEQSFVRLRPGHEAPCFATWGTSNRTALIRIPEVTEPEDTRIEYRGGDASGSPYLLCAAILAAGLDGIEKKITPPPEVTCNCDTLTEEQIKSMNIKKLPSSFEETLAILKESKWLRSVFGDHAIEFLIKRGHNKSNKH